MDSTMPNQAAQEILELLKTGEQSFRLGGQHDVILVLGLESTMEPGNPAININDSTTLTKPIYPQLLMDGDTSSAYYNCAYFGDTSNKVQEITSAYFVKKVLDHAKRVKLVFVVDNQAVDVTSFLKLVQRATTFIDDIDQFKDSIALTVSNVQTNYKNELATDEREIEKFAKFLKEVKINIQQNIANENDDLDYEKALKFVEVFLSKPHNTNIAILRAPNDSIKSKEVIKKLLQENIKFVAITKFDFLYTTSRMAQDLLIDTVGLLNTAVAQNVRGILKNYYESKINQTDSIYDLKAKLSRDREAVSKLMSKNYQTPNDVVKAITNAIDDDDFRMQSTIRSNFSFQTRYLEFLRSVVKTYSHIDSKNWMLPLDAAVEFISAANDWYVFLADFYDKLSVYKNWMHLKTFAKNHTDSSTIVEFIKKFIKPTNYDIIKYVKNDIKFRHLNLQPLTQETTFSTVDDKLIVKGIYVLLSEVVSKLNSSEINTLEILALDTVYINADLNLSSRAMSVTIIAPQWEIVGTKRIELDGAPGKKISPLKAAYSTSTTKKASDGMPGNPGGPAGAFFGIGEKFVNDKNLFISANGGRGGNGQNGADGAAGAKGTDANMPFTDGFERVYNGIAEERLKNTGFKYIKNYTAIDKGSSNTHYILFGSDGKVGQNGGDGGKGGLTGHSGNVDIFSLDQNTTIVVSNKEISNGAAGVGGSGGLGGPNGITRKVVWHVEYGYFSTEGRFLDNGTIHGEARRGSAGINGKNLVNMKSPTGKIVIQEQWRLVHNYKLYLMENLPFVREVNKRTMTQFINRLETTPQIKNLYNTVGLIADFQGIEKLNYRLNQKVDFLPFYNLLLHRIDRNKMVRNNVYVAVLSKIHNLNDNKNKNTNLIINLEAYLELAINNIEKLRIAEQSNREAARLTLINQIRDSYKDNIDNKIREARTMIDMHISPAIDEIFEDLSGEIDKLSKEVRRYIADATEAKMELKQTERQLKDIMVANIIFGIVNVAASALQLFGPVGAIAGKFIGEAVSFVQDETTPTVSVKMPRTFDINTEVNPITLPECSPRKARKQRSRSASAVFTPLRKAVDNYKINNNMLKKVRDTIADVDNTIATLEKFEGKVLNFMTESFESVKDYLKCEEDAFSSESSATLIVKKWQIQRTLKDLQIQMRQMTAEFEVKDNLARCIEKLDEAMTTMINVYDQIQDYKDQVALGKYISDIASAGYDNEYGNVIINKAMAELQLTITSNIVMQQYRYVFNSYKQYVFPFADYYLDKFITDSQPGDAQSTLTNIVKNIENFKSAVMEDKTTIGMYDKHIRTYDFYYEDDANEPFYMWQNGDYSTEITKLFSGEEIALVAEVSESGDKMWAIKFNVAEIAFKSDNRTLQNEMNDELKKFSMKMTHSGNSYYKCGDDFYTISSDSQTLVYGFTRDANNHPTYTNNVYEKLKAGDPLLSPYATWSLQLEPTLDENNFDRLKTYANSVDVILNGKGQFVHDSADICSNNLQHHYAPYVPIAYVKKTDEVTENGMCYICKRPDNHFMNTSAKASASSISSPLNNIVNWIFGSFAWISTNQVHGTSFESAREHVFSEPHKFYDNVDNVLAIAPVLVHLWNKFFNRNSAVANSKARSVVIDSLRIETWERTLENAGDLTDALKKVLGAAHADLAWYVDALDARRRQFEEMKLKDEFDYVDVKELEINLTAFQIDLEEDIRYNRNFNNAKNVAAVSTAMAKLALNIKRLSKYNETTRPSYDGLQWKTGGDLITNNNVTKMPYRSCNREGLGYSYDKVSLLQLQ